MKNIFRIYKRDVKNVVSNWVALVVVIGLMILPALYAWFNIKSSWDPYGNTIGIAVALVNEDEGAEFRGKKINVGEELEKQLKSNKNIGWKFVDKKEAEKGVMYGKYYASINIPKDFSYKILSIVREKQQKPELIYSVNEKTNAVAPKITEKGVSSIQAQIGKTFVKTVNGIIFDLFNKFGIELEKEKPQLTKVKDLILEADSKVPEINKAIDEFYKGAITLEDFIKRLEKDMPILEETIKKSSEVAKDGEEFLTKGKEGIKNLSPYIKQDLIMSKDICDDVEILAGYAVDSISTNSVRTKEFLIKINNKYAKAASKIENINKVLESLYNISNNKVIYNMMNKLNTIKGRINNQINLVNSAIAAIDRGEKPSVDLLSNIKNGANDINKALSYIIDNYDSEIIPNINKTADNLIVIADNTLKLLQYAQRDLPIAQDLMGKAYKGTEKGIEDIKLLKERMPGIEKSLHSLAEKLKKLDDDESVNEIIKLLKNDAKKESEFLANPVDIKVNRVFPIPNYGSAMTPFFTTLSLWVGALIMVSIISVEPLVLEEGKKIKPYEAYFGRYLTFLTIGIFQALIVTLGDIFILKVYAVNKLLFVLYALFISMVFSMIVYTLVSVFGNIGKALAVILLVLQISASGGTFPIQVTPPFFQHLNPFLPFTYAISGMREAVGGVLWNLLYYDAGILLIYFGVSIVVALLLKKKINALNKGFVEKFKHSGLVGH
jgi:putative membrane protein